ncbi:MAG: SUMF1/EgtB/PvdO family nonheme iron enzyme, partial [Spirochaetaceae bacterium]|nr:SUMF1/EgtB/PvdO family nonheme iron enzyme [Spirochaetaceae bacterium]
DRNVKWSISPDGVATVDRDTGLVILISPTENNGEAIITAETVGLDAGGNKKSASCTVKVNTVPVGNVTVFPQTLNLDAGGSQSTLTAFVEPYYATDKRVTWSVELPNPAGVTVNSSGVVMPGTVAGTATVKARSVSDSGKSGSCIVMVKAADAVLVSLPVADEYRFLPGGRIESTYLWATVMGTMNDDNPTTTAPAGGIDVDSFVIGRMEVRYALWCAVKAWGGEHGYNFQNKGRAGNTGSAGDAVTEANRNQPVTEVSWRDVVVWCNAYSEIIRKDPVYYADDAGTILLKDSRDTNATAVDGAKQLDRNGYRLPTEEEWEYAARGGEPGGDDTPWAYHWAGINTDTELGNFAWYKGNTNTTNFVGQKLANGAGLYDMSGNVWEWCFDKLIVSDITYHVIRGGGWDDPATGCSVAYRGYYSSTAKINTLGFRLVCSR